MKEYFINRREKFIATLPNGCVALLFSGVKKNMSNDLDYPFVVDKNFYYLTGLEEDKLIYMLIKGNDFYKEFLFTEERSKEKELWIGPRMKRHDILEISGLENVYSLNDFDRVLGSYLKSDTQGVFDAIYLNLPKTVDPFNKKVDEYYANKLKEEYPNIYFRSLYNNVCNLRLIKDKLEIENICKAISITKQGICEMMKNAKNCNYEYEVESFYVWTLKQHNTIESFKTICASGVNATILHYEDNNSAFLDDTLILCDLGSLKNNYASDISRTFPKYGKFTDMQKKIYQIVLNCNKEMIKKLKDGYSRREYEEEAANLLAKGLIELGIIKEFDEVFKYYYHSVGHMLGLDVHDVGKFDEFKAGMVVTCEPGLYIPELNIGIRIEDDILITKDGSINLSKDIIKEIDEIEEFMTNC
ncbi:MAG: aminopeptidase P N-terminal domain-containing protein [Acholeplasmatales bacterium]|nr:aminopeptidase P N-terminal domain-containing protein [Acholeplasmatales bacterium]